MARSQAWRGLVVGLCYGLCRIRGLVVECRLSSDIVRQFVGFPCLVRCQLYIYD